MWAEVEEHTPGSIYFSLKPLINLSEINQLLHGLQTQSDSTYAAHYLKHHATYVPHALLI